MPTIKQPVLTKDVSHWFARVKVVSQYIVERVSRPVQNAVALGPLLEFGRAWRPELRYRSRSSGGAVLFFTASAR